MSIVHVNHRFADVGGLRVFYRETGPADGPVLLLLHGFPSSSRQYLRLMESVGTSLRVIAPDMPGFGFSDAPQAQSAGGPQRYSFDELARYMDAFCEVLGLERFVLYMFDYGGPVGFRMIEAHPERVAGLVIQNANAYDEGMSEMALGLAAQTPASPGGEGIVRGILTAEVTRNQYLTGARHPERISPDGWTMDQHFLDLPGRAQIQIELALDYHSNLALYPKWQAWLRQYRPPALVIWGRNDPFFLEAGARAYLRDLPHADLMLLDTGHFALEECLADIAPAVAAFGERHLHVASSD